MRLTVKRILRKLSFSKIFWKVLAIPANNEQNPIFTDIKG